ncbi:hypothetical protein NM688_g5353 [Phlebia brevispora]|uniref:Uncharacterized protein n=1 Tax=Phlebia brevispora TaxID=194682 RepID=A0ACC1SWJ8_9APHY|nr:hypothetical protein NM688_g5353 [Phlebia brevispora]
MLIIQLDPPALLPTMFKSVPSAEANGVVRDVVSVLLQTSLRMFGQPGVMVNNPDIVQACFNCMETVAQHFIAVFYLLPPDLFNALIQCAIGALSLQERYALVSACTFLSSLVNRTATTDDLGDAKQAFVRAHGRSVMHALLSDFAGCCAASKAWMVDILNAPDFMPSKATPEAKEKFVKTIFGSRSLKRTRDAAQQFVLVARGLEGTSFGYASVTM